MLPVEQHTTTRLFGNKGQLTRLYLHYTMSYHFIVILLVMEI